MPSSTLVLDSRRALLAVIAAAWAGALAGAVLLAWPSPGGGSGAAPRVETRTDAAPAPGLGRRIPVSFGSLSVDSASRLTGPRRAAGLRLRRGDLPLQVAVTFVNTSSRTVRFSPSLFRLLPAAGTPAIAATGGDLAEQRVGARRARRFVLRFAVPGSARQLPDLEVRDPAAGTRTAVPLGTRRALPSFDHVGHTTGPDGRAHP